MSNTRNKNRLYSAIIVAILSIAVVLLTLYLNGWNFLILLNAVLIGIITSIIGSGSFLLILWFFKPRLKISPNNAHFNHRVEGEVWALKIINPSKFFSLFDVSISLYSISNYNVYGGKNGHLSKIELKKDKIEFIPTLKSKEEDKDAKFARLLFTSHNLKAVLEKEETILFHVKASHELSGFSKVFQREYFSKSIIKDGKFSHGDSFEIHI